MTPRIWHRLSPRIASRSNALARIGLALFLAAIAILVVGQTAGALSPKLGGIVAMLMAAMFGLFGLGLTSTWFKEPPPKFEEHPLKSAVLCVGAAFFDLYVSSCASLVLIGLAVVVAA